MGDAVHPKLAEVGVGGVLVVDGDEVGAARVAVFDATDGRQKGSAGVGKQHTQARVLVQHPCENHGTRCPGSLGGHAYKPGQPILLHVRLAHHVPRVDEQRHAELLAGFVKRRESRVAQVESIHVGPDLHTLQPGGMGLTEHLDGPVRVLHRDRGQPHVVFGMVAHNLGQVVVQEPRQVGSILRLGPVGKHHGDGADHLDLHPGLSILLDALLGVPTIGGDFSEKQVVPHHVGKPRAGHLQMDESPVAEFLRPFGHDPGQNVRVAVYFEHGRSFLRLPRYTKVMPPFSPAASPNG